MKVFVFCFDENFLEWFEKCLVLGFLVTILNSRLFFFLVGNFYAKLELVKEGLTYKFVGLVESPCLAKPFKVVRPDMSCSIVLSTDATGL